MKRHSIFVPVCLLLLVSCRQVTTSPPAKEQKSKSSAAPVIQVAAGGEIDEGEDILEMVRQWNSNLPAPGSEFEPGSVSPRESDLPKVTHSETGFEIQLPSESPVPTPTVRDGKLFVSGGFGSQEYYCFNAESGKLIWALDISDDGPTSAIPYDDGMYFNTESCTIFAVNAQTGKMLWSHYLGDPLMSTPTVAEGRVFTVYPAEEPPIAGDPKAIENPDLSGDCQNPNEDETLEESKSQDSKVSFDQPAPDEIAPGPTHVAACFDAKTGKVLWQKWIDGDCMTAPVAAGDVLYITTLAGTVFKLDQKDGTILAARRLRATSTPVIVADSKLYYTRRADDGDSKDEISEAIAAGQIGKTAYLAATRKAPYLDSDIQRTSPFSEAASGFEAGNGIGGGFGGGFGGGGGNAAPPSRLDRRSGSGETPRNSVIGIDQLAQADDVNTIDPGEVAEGEQPEPLSDEGEPDMLAKQQQLAADVIGLGNVSTLLAYQGSRVLNWGQFNFNCMGDALYCTATNSGEIVWEMKLDGDLEKEGGRLAAAPVAAGQYLFVSTLSGHVLQIDPKSGKTKKKHEIGAPMRFPPAVHNGRIYATTQDGRVVCINTGDRKLTGWPMSGRDARHSRVYRSGK